MAGCWNRNPVGAWLSCLLIAFALLAQPALGEERILEFHSDITVLQSGVLEVTETIRVVAEGREIRRGIYRDFPTRYRSPSGAKFKVGFEILDITRNHGQESWHTERRSIVVVKKPDLASGLVNGLRIYIGDKDVYLKPGEYTYRIRYRTTRQIGFFDSHDELYWNVTGNGWVFPIDRASAVVKLPAETPAGSVEVEAYTGYQGETGQDYTAAVNHLGQGEFKTTRVLEPRQGLTIVVTWPKGVVREPTIGEKIGYFVRDNGSILIVVIGVLILLGYYLAVWNRVGRDPEGGTIVPLFRPPANISPAAARYLHHMAFDNKAYAAAVINMAVKGYLHITDEDGEYTVSREEGADKSVLSKGEKSVVDLLLAGRQSVTFKKSNNVRIRNSVKALKSTLRKEFHTTQFKLNTMYLAPGFLISVLIMLAAGVGEGGDVLIPVLFLGVWLSVWTFTVFILVKQGQIFLSVIFGFFEIFALIALFTAAPLYLIAILAVLIVLNIVFYYLMRAPTNSGRRLMDQIEGFKLYLSTAEEDRLNTLNPPEKTPELFEKYLPYALALGVDQAWSERFAAVLSRAAAEESGYRPRWYSGNRFGSFNSRGFSSSLGSSLSKAVASSSVAPGSRSGGGGGGFSGGGGGGGGGGGW